MSSSSLLTRWFWLPLMLAVSVIPRAFAASFSDVPLSHPNAQAISALADLHVIQGNPDGSFRPESSVNRAEMLTLLYRTKQMTASAPSTPCFTDVPVEAWFSAVVCDAAAQSVVKGYPGNLFRPEQSVTTAEALKMTVEILGIPRKNETFVSYSDVSDGQWYRDYVATGLGMSILPLSPDEKTIFRGDVALSRGNAAQMIFNALHAIPLSSSSTSSSSSSSDAMMEQSTASAASTSSRAAVQTDNGYVSATSSKNVTVPFSAIKQFTARETALYTFQLDAQQTVSFLARTTEGAAPDCRLYKLEEDGVSYQYYLGSITGDDCWMRVTLDAGNYQFEVPGKDGLTVTVEGMSATGDGNDGFVDAVPLGRGIPVIETLQIGDYADWFTFGVTHQTELNVELKSVDSTSTLQCVIYPLKDVALYGFTWPECNHDYVYEPGTYVIGVLHSLTNLHLGKQQEESFSIRLQ